MRASWKAPWIRKSGGQLARGVASGQRQKRKNNPKEISILLMRWYTLKVESRILGWQHNSQSHKSTIIGKIHNVIYLIRLTFHCASDAVNNGLRLRFIFISQLPVAGSATATTAAVVVVLISPSIHITCPHTPIMVWRWCHLENCICITGEPLILYSNPRSI